MKPPDLDSRIAAFGDLVDQVRRAFLHLEVGHCDLRQLATVKSSVDRLANMCGPAKSDIAVRAAELRRTDTSNIVDDTLNPQGRTPSSDELIEKDRAGVLDNLPGMDDATRSGDLPAVYADVIAKALQNQSPEVQSEFYRRHQDLAEVAAKLSVAEFKQHVVHLVEMLLFAMGVRQHEQQRQRRRASTFTELATRMFGLSGRWDPLTGQAMNAEITAEVNAIFHTRRDDPTDTRSREQIVADAIHNLICGNRISQTTTNGGNGGATVVIITDDKTARHGPHDQSVHEYADGTPVGFDTLHDLLAEPATETIEAVVNQHGVVQTLGDANLNLGRSTRFASKEQRLALRVMHRTCIFPGCSVPFDACEQHHLIEWHHDGRSDLIDLGPVCVRHHHRLHAHDWQLRFHPDTRDLTITYPDGTVRTHRFTGLAPPGGADPPGDPPPGDDTSTPDGHAA